MDEAEFTRVKMCGLRRMEDIAAANPLVVECPFWQLQQEGFALRGKWKTDFFRNDNRCIHLFYITNTGIHLFNISDNCL